MSPRPEETKQVVRAVYGAIAAQRTAAETPCCGPEALPLIPFSDYSPEEIASVPSGAYLGEGSGNPVRWARLRRGEVVVDLGSGAGMDVFLAANQVGPTGRVVGIDMTPEMVSRAVANAAGAQYPQVEFRLADIEHIPLCDGLADVVLSNCVINLAPDKKEVFREAWRLLRPGGRLSISDIVRRPTGQAAAPGTSPENAAEWCACLAGAMVEQEYLELIRSVGFRKVRIVAKRPALTQPTDGTAMAWAITLVAGKPAAIRKSPTVPSTRARRARPQRARD